VWSRLSRFGRELFQAATDLVAVGRAADEDMRGRGREADSDQLDMHVVHGRDTTVPGDRRRDVRRRVPFRRRLRQDPPGLAQLAGVGGDEGQVAVQMR